MVVWIAQSVKVLVFTRGPGFKSQGQTISPVFAWSLVKMWALTKGWSKMVRASYWHAPTLRGFGAVSEQYLQAVGKVQFLGSQEVIGLSDRFICK